MSKLDKALTASYIVTGILSAYDAWWRRRRDARADAQWQQKSDDKDRRIAELEKRLEVLEAASRTVSQR